MTTPLQVDGVDISHHQADPLDFGKAKAAGVRWIYHKATEGTSYRDPKYVARRAAAKAAGLPFGAYHFARPNGDAQADAKAEARYFLAYATPKPGDMRPVLDLEVAGGMTLLALRQWAAAFIAEVVAQTGHRPIVYTPYDLGAYDDGCLIWRPRYNDRNNPPALPWDIWQFSNGVYGVPDSVPGLGHVDLNTMRKGLSLDQLRIPKPPSSAAKPKRNRVAEARELLRAARANRGPNTQRKIDAALKDLEGIR